MPAVLNIQYTEPSQRIATVRADILFNDPISVPFQMPGYTPVAVSADGATGAATYTNAELQALPRAADDPALFARIPGANLTADGIAIPAAWGGFFEQDLYRLAVTASAGTVRVTATFARVRPA